MRRLGVPICDRRAVMEGIQAHGARAVHRERVSARHFRYGTAVVLVVPRSAGSSWRPDFSSTITADVWIKSRAPARALELSSARSREPTHPLSRSR